ncbi:hypothetical protein NP603_12530 [Methylomonas sp. SURF-1]|uniref:Phospholipase C/D domain-containing protein n=1 Tax=Methylomonas aurea TaxID=2952224 RepID=A0ABT1UI69_9GAMM|nr:hypothetical protein [Methylomonas sp. SURF-1]MCQ8181937.1 hypothetical protein [Methylomonas sp. SURF-1]
MVNKLLCCTIIKLNFIVIVIFALFSERVTAFDVATISKAGDGNHGSITKECVQQTGLFPIANELAVSAESIDWRDTPGNYLGNRNYEPKKHCDRLDGQSHMDAFTKCYNYYQHTFNYAINQARVGDRAGAIKEIGRWMHTLQDAYSHGNAAWEASGAEAIKNCFANPLSEDFNELQAPTNPQCSIPSDNSWGYYLTTYPDAERPHSKYATDKEDQNPTARSITTKCVSGMCGTQCTNFQCAYYGAVETCRAAANTFFERCDALCRKTLGL